MLILLAFFLRVALKRVALRSNVPFINHYALSAFHVAAPGRFVQRAAHFQNAFQDSKMNLN